MSRGPGVVEFGVASGATASAAGVEDLSAPSASAVAVAADSPDASMPDSGVTSVWEVIGGAADLVASSPGGVVLDSDAAVVSRSGITKVVRRGSSPFVGAGEERSGIAAGVAAGAVSGDGGAGLQREFPLVRRRH